MGGCGVGSVGFVIDSGGWFAGATGQCQGVTAWIDTDEPPSSSERFIHFRVVAAVAAAAAAASNSPRKPHGASTLHTTYHNTKK